MMNRTLVIALALAVLSLIPVACSPIQAPTTALRGFEPCEAGRFRSNLLGLQRDYRPLRADSCKEGLLPFDMGAWVEAPLNSHKAKGLRTLILGCANLTPDSADCSYGGPLGHSVTLQTNFNMSAYPDVAIVQRAVLAFHVRDNVDFFAQTAQLRGRLMTPDALESLGSQVLQPPVQPGWVIFDITAFAARAINERRNSVSFELSLPCGRSESELVTVSVLDEEPRLIVEYR
jgi:hypothetical protein